MLDSYPAATQHPGLASKQGYSDGKRNSVSGVICHSEEGYQSYGLEELADPNIMLSWHFTVLKTGEVQQHYPLTAVCYHGGNEPINEMLVGIEHEGIKGQSLTPEQLAASVALVNWIAVQGNWKPERHVNLWEHNEVVQSYSPNAGPTPCPNGRIPWEAYVESGDMITYQTLTQSEDIEAIKKAVDAIGGQDGQFIGAITGGYTPKPGNKALIIEVKA